MKKISLARKIYYGLILIIAPILIYLFAVRGMRFFLVPSGSMEPTLVPGDYLVTLNVDQYNRGDIVVLRDPVEEGAYIVKRIVGLAGDTVAVEGGALVLNGKYASEPYVPEFMNRDLPPVTVPEGGVFVMGDNRNHSEDSREWHDSHGSLPVSSIIGQVRLRYLPLDRASTIHGFPLANAEGK